MPSEATFLQTTAIGALRVDPAQHLRGLAHLSAASGLVRHQGALYVVADDELQLAVFDDQATPFGQGQLRRLLQGSLPDDARARKRAKPDLESLALLPPLPGCPAGALLALGSGSAPQRMLAVLVALDAGGAPNGRMAEVDLAPLYAPLRKHFADLNIEGAFVQSGELLLLQRGNQGDRRSATIHYDWNLLAPWLAGRASAPPAPKRVQLLQLGDSGGVPLALTDGCALHGGDWMFCAVAEATANSVDDGACVGSAIGIVAPDGRLRCRYLLQGAPKIEGIAAQPDGAGGWRVSLVTDPDAPELPAQLLQVRLAAL